MAPEMFQANPSSSMKIVRGRQNDIWAAGVTLYYLLTKKYPFSAKSIHELAAQVRS